MNLSMSGLPAIVMVVGFIVVFSAPVWLAARMVGAEHPTLLRSALALIVGGVCTAVVASIFGGFALLLAPLVFLFSFKTVLGTSFLGSIGLVILALIGYAAMVHFIGAAFTVTGGGTTA